MRNERGSASVLVVTMIAVLIMVSGAATVVVAIVRTHRVAQSAADLSALAGARAIQEGGDGCASADEVAARNGARLLSCRTETTSTEVEVAVDAPRWRGHGAVLTARARAGPVQP